jgi:hypothetical protein
MRASRPPVFLSAPYYPGGSGSGPNGPGKSAQPRQDALLYGASGILATVVITEKLRASRFALICYVGCHLPWTTYASKMQPLDQILKEEL